MRIAIDARYLNAHYSGIAKYSENLLNSLAKVDQENEYTVFIHTSFTRRLRLGENFRVVTYPALPVSMRTLFSFGQRVRRAKCDFLHSLSPMAPLLGIKRMILTIHDLNLLNPEESPERAAPPLFRGGRAAFFQRLAMPHFIRSATWLMTVSEATKNSLSQYFPSSEHKTIVIRSGVEETYCSPPEDALLQLVHKNLKLPQNYLLYIGTASPNKNLPRMLRAFGRVRQQHPDTLGSLKFILALGHDKLPPECQRIVRDMDLDEHIRILGPVTEEEKRVLYARATLLFSVTRGEGFGLPIVEAQASGLPVLAGADAAVPEVTCGSALLVNPGDEDLITEKLRMILTDADLRAQFAQLGRENVKRFSWETTAQRVVEIYNLLM
ncbi:MAG TPA: glycosyltransferase family 1 protein [Candidatus Sumerlaeota bacterium]|nr:glycosyltransferase family 1 protein [Candidatus Sumerlaeota bacterium]HPS02180.1 glycosyltransferase family 1 protein [Candidatus Sumerlaeota bacterium]